MDDDGNFLHDTHDILPTWRINLWRRTKVHETIIDRKGNPCEIFLFNWEKDIGWCDHLCLTCHLKCEIYELVYEGRKIYYEGD